MAHEEKGIEQEAVDQFKTGAESFFPGGDPNGMLENPDPGFAPFDPSDGPKPKKPHEHHLFGRHKDKESDDAAE